jgi:hypothetical protein
MGASSWQDQQYADFSEMFEQQAQALLKILEEIETEQVPHLHRVAERAEEILEE